MRIGPESVAISQPGMGQCRRCKTTWSFVEPHVTDYEDGRGMFVLCEQCWDETALPSRRLTYYRVLWEEWRSLNDRHPELEFDLPAWGIILAAVLKEGAAP
jgi:hypothetical protein